MRERDLRYRLIFLIAAALLIRRASLAPTILRKKVILSTVGKKIRD